MNDDDEDDDYDPPEFWLIKDFPPFPKGYKPTAAQRDAMRLWEIAIHNHRKSEYAVLLHPGKSAKGDVVELVLCLPVEYYTIRQEGRDEFVVRHKGINQQEIYRGPGPVKIVVRKS